MHSVSNTLLEYTSFYISKNITSYTFFVESLQCILKEKNNGEFMFSIAL